MPAPLITIEEARQRVLAAVARPLGTETVAVDLALDRVLRQDVRARHDVPPFRGSAMDGYALAAAGPEPDDYRIVGESRAGAPYAGSLGCGEAVRISTGAAVPEQTRAVVRQEDTAVEGEHLYTRSAVADGANIRGAGEDMRAGDAILADGQPLGPSELAAAIASGHGGKLIVARRPAVAIITTGDELREPGAELDEGTIHNSNGPMLRALSLRAGAIAGEARLVADEPRATEEALREALAEADVVLVTGGVSVGPHDHVKAALATLGVTERFWGVALQPGKPTWFGARGDRLVFGLPGNPVSAAVTFSLFARPAITALLGARPPRQPIVTASLAGPVRRSRERDRMIRVRLRQDGDRLLAEPTGAQDSHLVTSLGAADALAFVPRGEGRMEAGERVALEPVPGR